MYWKGLLLAPCSAMSLASSFFKKGAKASLREGDKEEKKKKKERGGEVLLSLSLLSNHAVRGTNEPKVNPTKWSSSRSHSV